MLHALTSRKLEVSRKITISTTIAHASFLSPIARAFVSAGARPNSILARVEAAVNTHADLHLPMSLIYKAVQIEADELDDLTLGFRAGHLFAGIAFRENFPEELKGKSLPNAILDISIWLSKNTTGTPIHLDVSKESATLSQKRENIDATATAQADAFTVAAMIETIRLYAHDQYELDKIAIAVSHPGLLPANTLRLSSVKTLSYSGFILDFPVDWLLSSLGKLTIGPSKLISGEDNFLLAFEDALSHIIGIPLPNLTRTAELLNLKPRELQLELEQRGTTFSKVTTRINCKFATDQLIEGKMTATKIGEALGYSDHSSFSRAFKGWTEMSPEQFRAARARLDTPGHTSSADHSD